MVPDHQEKKALHTSHDRESEAEPKKKRSAKCEKSVFTVYCI